MKIGNLTYRHDSIPKQVWSVAASILREQPFVPMSPAQIDGDKLYLCAAAGLADAGLRLFRTPEQAVEFRRNLKSTMSFASVEDVFAELGWNHSVCHEALKFNDSLSKRERKSRVVALFHELARPQ